MSKKIDRIEAKKKELESNLERLQSGLETNLENVKSEVTQHINPSLVIKTYPLSAFGTSIIVGFLITQIGRKKSKKIENNKNIIAESLSTSLKKRLTKKAANMVLDYIEDRFKSNFSGSHDQNS